MKKFLGILTLALLAYTFQPSLILAQDGEKTLSFNPESTTITIDGTSNRDDWTVTAEQFEGYVTINENEGEAPDIIQASLVVKAQEMSGGRSSIMDRLMRDALKAREHNDIEFNLTGVETDGNGDSFNVITSGDLTLAGVTRTIEVPLEGTRLSNGNYQFTGSYALNMTEYEISPPTAMFGALVTGDEVIINFDIVADNN
ncbi:MAG: YceI family protein [Balneolaceae bacterium]|nr:YceI family protein [Balneolaceae bacterium]